MPAAMACAVAQVAVHRDQLGDGGAVLARKCHDDPLLRSHATLYRHFPTRGDLLVAVYADEVTALCEQGAALLHESSAAQALFTWLDSFVATKRALALAATESTDELRTELFDHWQESMRSTAEGLLVRAQDAGIVRTDLTVADMLALTSAAAVAGTGTHHARQLLRILHHGFAGLEQPREQSNQPASSLIASTT